MPNRNRALCGGRTCEGNRIIIAEFVPQVWVQDIAMTVDPEGPTTFDVTAEVLAMGEAAARALRDDQIETDLFKDSTNAPAWVKEWRGPFYIELQESIANYFDALAE